MVTQSVSGTYKNGWPGSKNTILEAPIAFLVMKVASSAAKHHYYGTVVFKGISDFESLTADRSKLPNLTSDEDDG